MPSNIADEYLLNNKNYEPEISKHNKFEIIYKKHSWMQSTVPLLIFVLLFISFVIKDQKRK